jgi:hypothetical protein
MWAAAGTKAPRQHLHSRTFIRRPPCPCVRCCWLLPQLLSALLPLRRPELLRVGSEAVGATAVRPSVWASGSASQARDTTAAAVITAVATRSMATAVADAGGVRSSTPRMGLALVAFGFAGKAELARNSAHHHCSAWNSSRCSTVLVVLPLVWGVHAQSKPASPTFFASAMGNVLRHGDAASCANTAYEALTALVASSDTDRNSMSSSSIPSSPRSTSLCNIARRVRWSSTERASTAR